MPVTFWVGKPKPKTTHEAIAYKRLVGLIKQQFDSSKTPVFVLFDFSTGSENMDMAVFTPEALIMVELKECAAPVKGNENGGWEVLDGKQPPEPLDGGRHGNPFLQISDYRYDFIKYLDRNRNRFLSEQKASQVRFDHVSGMIVFSPALDPLNQLSLAHHPWLHIVGLEQAADRIQSLTSPMFHFSEQELYALVSEVMRCKPTGDAPATPPPSPEPEPATPLEWQPIDGTSKDSQWYVPFKVGPGSIGDYQAKAAQGDPAGHQVTGLAYFKLSKGPADDLQALAHFRAAARAGNLTSRVYFWVIHLQGRAPAEPGASERAAGLHRQAAESGFGEAALWLGMAYLQGFGFPVNLPEAAAWIRKASDLGWSEATYALGVLYQQGRGVPQDMTEGIRWVLDAAERGYGQAQNEIAQRYWFGDGVAQQLSAAAFWYERASLNGIAHANGALGIMYANGQGVVKSEANALHWYRKGLEAGDGLSQCMMAHRYRLGETPGIQQNVPKALELYGMAAEQGNPEAQTMLGAIYIRGLGTPKDVALARHWAEKAAAQGYGDGEYLLAQMYEEGIGVESDISRAVRLYSSAASKGIEDARVLMDRYNQTGSFR